MRRLICVLAAFWVLTGCAPLLERTYAVSEPHSSRFWESEAAGTLRAESYQDIVNDLLLLIGQHTETAALRLYNFTSDFSVADTLEQATTEIQQDTPMGAYAVEYITAVSQAQRGYYEIAVKISYRRSLEQIQAVVNATSPEALYSLLTDAMENEKSELAVRLGYWGPDGFDQLNAAVSLVREEFGREDTPDWVVNFFPSENAPGLVEFLLDGQDAPLPADVSKPEEVPEEEADGVGPDAEDAGQQESEDGMQDGTETDKDAVPPRNGHGWTAGLVA